MDWFSILKKKPSKKARKKRKKAGGYSRQKSKVNQSGNYTKPKLRKRLFYQIKRGTKGGPAGVWSARKAQMLAAKYKRLGGGYRD